MKLAGFANKYAGQRAFIIGNGPSLNKMDLTKLAGEITFGVNSIFYNFEKMGFKPTFYVVEDRLVAQDRRKEINSLTGMVKIFGKYMQKYHIKDKGNVVWANVIVDYFDYPGFPHFSQNASKCLWAGGTVTYLCMQLAYYMGFAEVYLVGFDHSYIIPSDFKVEGTVITSTSNDPNHFHPEYFGEGKRWHDPRLDRMELAYKRTKEVFERNGRRVYNATVGGKLEVFERADYDSLFDNKGNENASLAAWDKLTSENSPRDAQLIEGDISRQVMQLQQGGANRYYQGDLAGARAMFHRALELAPEDSVLFANLGRIAVDMERFESALGYFQVATLINPDNVDHQGWTAMLAKRENQWETFDLACQHVHRLDPNHRMFHELQKRKLNHRLERLRHDSTGLTCRRKILVYTDSRGKNVSGRNDYKHYPARLAEEFDVDMFLCPEKWTTTFDFLTLSRYVRLEDYDVVVLHTGIVDVSPRHQSVAIERIYAQKKDILDEVFGESEIRRYLHTDMDCEYEGDKTINLYSLEMARKYLLPRLNEIPNLIWVNGNRIVPGWNGNYWKPRPANISIIEDYFALFAEKLDHVVDLMPWNRDEVMRYTLDNMHPNKEGSAYIYERIRERIESLNWPTKRIAERRNPVGCITPTTEQGLTDKAENSEVRISVVLATHRRPDYLAKSLESLSRQTLDRRCYEVIVVDNNSQDNTREVVEAYPWARYIFEEQLGLSYARNAGIQVARGEIMAFIDDDSEADPGWLQALLDTHEKLPNAWAAGGRILLKWDAERPEWLTEANYNNLGLRDFGDVPRPLNWPEGLAGSNCSFKKEVFSTLGYFKPELGRLGRIQLAHEETEIQKHVHQTGYLVYYNPDALVYHHVPASRMTRAYLADHALGNFVSNIFMKLCEEGKTDQVCRFVNRFRELINNSAFASDEAIEEQFLENLYSDLLLKNPDVDNEMRVRFCSGAVKYYLESKKYGKAIRRGIECLSLPGISRAQRSKLLLRLANVYLRQSKVAKAQETFYEALCTGPIEGEEAYQLFEAIGEYYRKQGNYSEIKGILEGILGSRNIPEENKAAAARCFCTFYMDYGIYDEAERIYLRVLATEGLKLASKDKLLLGLGGLYTKCGRYSEARTVLNKAVEVETAMAKAKSIAQQDSDQLSTLDRENVSTEDNAAPRVTGLIPENQQSRIDPKAPVSDPQSRYNEYDVLFLTKKQNKWRALKDAFKGKRAFLIGNGPSLNDTPLYLLKNESTLCFNRFNLMFERLAWKPTMYMTVDERVARDNADQINEIAKTSQFVFVPEIHPSGVDFRHFVEDRDNVYWLTLDWDGFSHDLPCAGLGGTVANVGLQVLSFMGFSPIYLVGVDMDYVDHATAIKHDARDWTATQDDDPNHFDPRYFGKGKKYHYPRLHENMLPSMRLARQEAESMGIRIINASAGGKLEVFPREDFTGLFDYTDKEKLNLFLRSIPGVYSTGESSTLNEAFPEATIADSEAQLETSRSNVCIVPADVGKVMIRSHIGSHIPFGPFEGEYVFLRRPEYSTAPKTPLRINAQANDPPGMQWAGATQDAAILNEVSRHTSQRKAELTQSERIDLLYDRIRANSRRILMENKDRYRGQRCIIIGNGPSLNNTDLSLLKNEYTFGLNKIFLLFDRIDWRPSFYVSVNPFVIQQSADRILSEIHGLKFLDFAAFRHLPYNEDTVHMLSLNGKGFSTDPCEGVFQMHTVTYVAMQLAYHMGFDEVLLVGVDHFFTAAQRGVPDQVIVQNGMDGDHFDPNYFAQGQRWNLPNLKGSEEGYRLARETFEKAGRRIYDATVGGHLTVFEKVGYYDIFGNSGHADLRTCITGGQPVI